MNVSTSLLALKVHWAKTPNRATLPSMRPPDNLSPTAEGRPTGRHIPFTLLHSV
jgi:hypothetical protein